MMLRVVTRRHGKRKIQLVAVKTPVADHSFCKLPIIFLNFRQSRAQSRKPGRHARVLSVFVEHQPIGMFLCTTSASLYGRLSSMSIPWPSSTTMGIHQSVMRRPAA